MFKSADEREQERLAKEAQRAQEEQARAELQRQRAEAREREAAASTPVGAATLAKQGGQRFLEVQLEVGGHTGSASFGAASGKRVVSSSADTLAQIEGVGWHLEHASYFFMMTGETSSQRVFLTGEATAISGITVGVYLFRNTDAAPAPPSV
jgi:hypothetical protein